MTLGEKITSLRNTHKFSQGDLAEKLNVSRQSVSKWETGASVPELDKLIMMSDLFHISLDELVKSDTVADKTLPEPLTSYFINPYDARKIIGIMMLGISLFGAIAGTYLSFTPLQVSGICFTLSAIVILIFSKHIKIICGWLTIILLYSIMALSVDGGPLFIFMFWTYPIFNIVPILSYIFWLLTILMIIFTIKTLKKTE